MKRASLIRRKWQYTFKQYIQDKNTTEFSSVALQPDKARNYPYLYCTHTNI